jgi:hypothetical protein
MSLPVAGKNVAKGERARAKLLADGLWKILTEGEGVAKEKIQALLAVQPEEEQGRDKLKIFPKK